MKGKGDHCFRDNQNGWGWLKLVTHQTLRYVRRRFIFILKTVVVLRFANDKLLPSDCLNILCVMKFRGSEVTTSGTSRPTSTLVREAGEVEDLEKDLMRRSAQLDQMQEVAFYVEELRLTPTTGSSAQIREISASHPWQCGLQHPGQEREVPVQGAV